MIELRIRMPTSARIPRIATNPIGTPNGTSVATTPISPSGAAAKTMAASRTLCICAMTSTAMMSSINGTTAAIGAWLSAEDSTEPPISTLTDGGRLSVYSATASVSAVTIVAGWSAVEMAASTVAVGRPSRCMMSGCSVPYSSRASEASGIGVPLGVESCRFWIASIDWRFAASPRAITSIR